MTGSNNTTAYINLLEHHYGDEVSAHILHALYISIGIWCVSANTFLLTVLWKNEALHTPANIFVANIALSDTCVGLSQIVARPLTISTHATVEFAKASCLVFTFSVLFTQLATIQALFLATCERYVKICHPYKYERIIRPVYIAPALSLSWMISLLYGCMITDSHWSPDTFCKLASIIGKTTLQACIPYLIILIFFLCFFNFRIFSTVMRHRRQIQELGQQQVTSDGEKHSEHMHRTKIIGVVVLFTCICYIPYFMSLVAGIFLHEESRAYRIIDNVTIAILYVNNMVNPVIFGWKDKSIRKYAKQLLRRQ